MKAIDLIERALLLGLTLLPLSVRMANAHGSGAHGGDPVEVRRLDMVEFINTELRQNLLDLTGYLNLNVIESVGIRRAVQDLLDRDLAGDVRSSPYIIRDSCVDGQGRQKAATSNLNEMGGEICFNPRFLARQNASNSEIVALAFHEHAHHFGYADSDARLQRAILQQVALEDPSSGTTYVWDIDSTDTNMKCFREDPTRRGYAVRQSRSVNRRWCDRHPGSSPGGRPTFVWDQGQNNIYCYMEDPARPGYGRPDGNAVDRAWCDQFPGSNPGGHPTFVWAPDSAGGRSCFLEDPVYPGRPRRGAKAVDRTWCDQHLSSVHPLMERLRAGETVNLHAAPGTDYCDATLSYDRSGRAYVFYQIGTFRGQQNQACSNSVSRSGFHRVYSCQSDFALSCRFENIITRSNEEFSNTLIEWDRIEISGNGEIRTEGFIRETGLVRSPRYGWVTNGTHPETATSTHYLVTSNNR